jgi:cellulose synthase/poly-beta-1,6-N-acetylglucosamine synthase-like glycosyltransferase
VNDNELEASCHLKVVALVPAHDEETSIAATVAALVEQDYWTEPRVVVIADNCTDGTAEAARNAGAEVLELHENQHKKPGALNTAFAIFRDEADLFVTVDADTVLPPDSIGLWAREFEANPKLAGCSAKFTMRLPEKGRFARFMTRLQRAEFSKWTDTALHRKDRSTSVLAGTACAIRVQALRDMVEVRGGNGPWDYGSLVEDFELTYRLRQLGWQTKVSADVRAYTDAMHTVKSLWAQRMKWQEGTVQDLTNFGVNKLTRRDWGQQALGVLAALNRLTYTFLLVVTALAHSLVFQWWWFIPTAVFILNDTKQSLRIPHRDKTDVLLAAVLVPQEIFAWLRAGWFFVAWMNVLRGKQTDRWVLQARAEGRA